MKRARKAVRVLLVLGALVALGTWGADRHVAAEARGYVTDRLADCAHAPVALVLGTARSTAEGRPNLFYRERLRAAAELFHAGLVRALIVSGDNSRPDYDEPTEMKADLVLAGVPERYVTCDYAGFRTLDSVIRAAEVFGQRRFVVVSQRFHCERAVYLARRSGLEAFGFAARDIDGYFGAKVRLREALARGLAIFDAVTGTEPRFLGRRETVVLRGG